LIQKKQNNSNAAMMEKCFFIITEEIQEVDFKMKNDSCNHFAFLLNGKLMKTKMNSEAVDFLDALEKGLPTYY